MVLNRLMYLAVLVEWLIPQFGHLSHEWTVFYVILNSYVVHESRTHASMIDSFGALMH
jgi:hypothetical protein